ncbi:hypothetical protein EAI_02984, partial [Harpegnathos saltator]
IQRCVAVKRIQTRLSLKVYSKFLGPYQITRILRNDRYIVNSL